MRIEPHAAAWRPAARGLAARSATANAEHPSAGASVDAVAVAGLSLGGAGMPAAAHAQGGVSVDDAVGTLVDVIRATGEVVKQGVSAAQTGAEYAKVAYDQVRMGGWAQGCGAGHAGQCARPAARGAGGDAWHAAQQPVPC